MSEYVAQQTLLGHWDQSLSWPRTALTAFLCACLLHLVPVEDWVCSDVLCLPQVEEKPDVTYSDVGGCKEQIEKLREVVETPLLHVSDLVTHVSSCVQHSE